MCDLRLSRILIISFYNSIIFIKSFKAFPRTHFQIIKSQLLYYMLHNSNILIPILFNYSIEIWENGEEENMKIWIITRKLMYFLKLTVIPLSSTIVFFSLFVKPCSRQTLKKHMHGHLATHLKPLKCLYTKCKMHICITILAQCSIALLSYSL